MRFTKRLGLMLMLALCLMAAASLPAMATGVSEAIEGTWDEASSEIRTVVDNVVFPAIDMILVIFFFAKVGMSYFEYKKHGTFEWSGPAILFACLVFTLTAPLYIWSILGM